mgnify:FL=1
MTGGVLVIRAADVTGPTLSPDPVRTWIEDRCGFVVPHPSFPDATVWGAPCRLWVGSESEARHPDGRVYVEVLDSFPDPEPSRWQWLLFFYPLIGQLALVERIWRFARKRT